MDSNTLSLLIITLFVIGVVLCKEKRIRWTGMWHV